MSFSLFKHTVLIILKEIVHKIDIVEKENELIKSKLDMYEHHFKSLQNLLVQIDMRLNEGSSTESLLYQF